MSWLSSEYRDSSRFHKLNSQSNLTYFVCTCSSSGKTGRQLSSLPASLSLPHCLVIHGPSMLSCESTNCINSLSICTIAFLCSIVHAYILDHPRCWKKTPSPRIPIVMDFVNNYFTDFLFGWPSEIFDFILYSYVYSYIVFNLTF